MKVNELTLKQKEQEFERDLAYEEFLRANNTEPTSCEIDHMEKVFCKATIFKPQNHPPFNNLHYQPLQGA